MKTSRILQYLFSVLIAVALLIYAFKDIKFSDILEKFQKANYAWIGLATIFFIISNLSRAYRWQLLLKPMGYEPTLYKSFLAVKVGYFINLVFPRAGEVSRSGFIQKMEGIPATTAFGTIILERMIDVLMLLSIILLVLLGEYQRLNELLVSNLTSKLASLGQGSTWVLLFILGLVAMIVLYFIRKNWANIMENKRLSKILAFFLKIIEGIVSIRKVENPFAFIFHTFLIWFMYFCMSYCLFFCFSNTADLGLWVGFVILAVGAMGMAAPVQGGIGTYHILVSATLVLYGLSKQEGLAMATFMHTVQTLVTMFTGGIALVISLFITRNKKIEQAIK